jgi:signal transduction histidine kinase
VNASEMALDLTVRGVPRALAPDVETVVFRVAMEAATNALKHAEAERVRVLLSFRPRSVRLVVADDGRGFVVEPELHAYAGRWGLLGMRERASQLRGDLRIKSNPGEGTTVVLRVPSRSHAALPDQGIAAAAHDPVV